MSIKVNGKKFPSPKCPKCGNPTFLRGSVQILSNESKYIFYCPDCEIYAPQANTAEKAAKNFEEVAKQYGIKVLAKVPMDPSLANLCDKGALELMECDCMEAAADYIENTLK